MKWKNRAINLEIINQRVYLKVQSLKTQTYSKVKLPDFSIQILKKYKNRNSQRLLPYFTKENLNIKIKKLLEIYGFTEVVGKRRQKRGISEMILRKGKEYRFCDLASLHTMRRSGITILLSLGMNEQMVRQISGHSSNSKEFNV